VRLCYHEWAGCTNFPNGILGKIRLFGIVEKGGLVCFIFITRGFFEGDVDLANGGHIDLLAIQQLSDG
jgi:hypothetical protein